MWRIWTPADRRRRGSPRTTPTRRVRSDPAVRSLVQPSSDRFGTRVRVTPARGSTSTGRESLATRHRHRSPATHRLHEFRGSVGLARPHLHGSPDRVVSHATQPVPCRDERRPGRQASRTRQQNTRAPHVRGQSDQPKPSARAQHGRATSARLPRGRGAPHDSDNAAAGPRTTTTRSRTRGGSPDGGRYPSAV